MTSCAFCGLVDSNLLEVRRRTGEEWSDRLRRYVVEYVEVGGICERCWRSLRAQPAPGLTMARAKPTPQLVIDRDNADKATKGKLETARPGARRNQGDL